LELQQYRFKLEAGKDNSRWFALVSVTGDLPCGMGITTRHATSLVPTLMPIAYNHAI